MTALNTIGFTQKSAEQFFGLLRASGVATVVDTRLRPDTQLSGFAKRQDLPYFLAQLAGCGYVHEPLLAPDATLLDQFRADKDWAAYARRYMALLTERDVLNRLDRAWYAAAPRCLLCSEHQPHHCHRRLAAEVLRQAWPELEVVHLVK